MEGKDSAGGWGSPENSFDYGVQEGSHGWNWDQGEWDGNEYGQGYDYGYDYGNNGDSTLNGLEQASYYPETYEWQDNQADQEWGAEITDGSEDESAPAVGFESGNNETNTLPGWNPSWAVRWRKRNCVPWNCSLCACENRYRAETCKQCGKVAPPDANKRIEDAAATLIQNCFRRARSRSMLRKACLSRYKQRFSAKQGKIYYQDKVTGKRLRKRPFLLRDGDQLEMDEREELEYKEHLEQQRAKERLNLARSEREEKFEIERKVKAKAEAQALIDAWEAKWHAPLVGASRNGELIANWQGFTIEDLHPRVYELGPTLTLVRFIGNPFGYLPVELVTSFRFVKVLSLSNCGLSDLPDEFCSMTCLEDLNLMRNSITRLPDKFGALGSLTSLHLASNQLKTVPDSFGQLKKLPRLNLEQNPITGFPESVTELHCKIISWSRMQLRQLPKSLGVFGMTLVSLSADHNRIKRIPKGIGQLRNLKHLSLCDNQIRNLPDDICKCRALERLWLDWNRISELPGDFLQLVNLQSIHLEGNPMKVPEMEIITKGVPTLMDWMKKNVTFYTEKERKRIVLELQGMLATMYEENMHDESRYELGCTTSAIGEKRDLYHAFSPDYLYAYAIPKWNAYVEQLSNLPHRASAMLEEYSSKRRKAVRQEQDEFNRLEELVLEQLDSISKDFSAAVEEEEGEDGGNKDPHKGESQDDYEARIAQIEKKALRQKAVIKELEEMQTIEDKLLEDSKRRRRATHMLMKCHRNLEPFDYTQDEVKDALGNFGDGYGLLFATNQEAVFRRCGCQRNGEPRLCVPVNETFRCSRNDACMLKIHCVTYLDRVRRNSLNEEEQELERRIEALTAEGWEYAKSAEGDNFFSGLSMIKAAEILEEERKQRFVVRYRQQLEKKRRKRRRKRQARKRALEKARQARHKALERKRRELVGELERSRGWEAEQCQDKITDVDDEIENPPQDIEIEILEQDEERAMEKFSLQSQRDQILIKYKPENPLMAGIRGRINNELEKRAKVVKTRLVEAYIDANRKDATLNTRKEYRLMRRIMFNWMNMSVRTTFFAWREAIKTKIFWNKRIQREQEQQAELEKANLAVDELYSKKEHSKWVEKFDEFHDVPYWQHEETSEVKWEAPRVEDCVFVPRFAGKKRKEFPPRFLPEDLEKEAAEADAAAAAAADARIESFEFVHNEEKY